MKIQSMNSLTNARSRMTDLASSISSVRAVAVDRYTVSLIGEDFAKGKVFKVVLSRNELELLNRAANKTHASVVLEAEFVGPLDDGAMHA
jgi:hypothetical protein